MLSQRNCARPKVFPEGLQIAKSIVRRYNDEARAVTTTVFEPYCGSPPIPGALQWNLDPVLIGVLFTVACVYAACYRRQKVEIGSRRVVGGWVGIAVLAAALISPLCNLSVALFTARAVQHVLMLLVAAPLLVLGMPRGRVGRFEAFAGPIGFAAILWFWHLPHFYDATLLNNVVYWMMHLTLFGTSISLWRVLLDDRGVDIFASLFTGVQMCGLGALLTLSPRPWFSVHALTTWPWGLSPSADQQLGGVVMWVVGGLLLSAFTIALLARMLASAGPARA
jgi:putative membrane protein